jgi:AraC family transcriptional regulator
MSHSREILIDAASGKRRPLLHQAPEFHSDPDAWPSVHVEQHRVGEVELSPVSPINHVFSVHLDGVNELEVADDGPFRLHRIGPGQVSLFPSGTIFASRTRSAGRFYTVSVTPQFFGNSSFPQENGQLTELIPQRGIQDAVIKALCDRIRDEITAGHPNGRLYVESLAQALCAHVGRHYSRESSQPTPSVSGSLSHHQLRRALEFIREHLAEDLPLADIARSAGLSPFHFARRFKQTTGQAPHQFLIQQRIERARHLLGQSEIPLAEIAAQCGFCDQSHLTNHFRRLVGTTPRRYRNRIETASTSPIHPTKLVGK